MEMFINPIIPSIIITVTVPFHNTTHILQQHNPLEGSSHKGTGYQINILATTYYYTIVIYSLYFL